MGEETQKMSNAPCECFFYCKCVSARQYMFLSDRS